MKSLKLISFIFTCLFLTSCSLKPVAVSQTEPLSNYKYYYIIPTESLSASTGSVYGNQYGTYGSSISKSINPADVISGRMIKEGLIRIPEIDPKLREETLIINYAETGRRDLFLAYTIEVTIQFISAQTHKQICSCTAEGMGSTEADDIREAITRGLDKIFNK